MDLRKLKTILRDLGNIWLIVGVVTFSTVLIAAYFHEMRSLKVMIFLTALFIYLGTLARIVTRDAKPPETKDAMLIAALSWLSIAILSSIPFILVLGFSPLDGVFEAMSGWTGTGLTVTPDSSQIPRTMQFWRSLTQWVGGVGVIVLMVSVLTRPGTGTHKLYRSEARSEKIHPSVMSTVRTIWWIFLGFSIVSVVLYWIAGMPPWEALNHAMTGIATGGFDITGNSLAAYDSVPIEIASIPMMLAGAIPFLVHYKIINGDLSAIKDLQTRYLLLIALIGSFILLAENALHFPILQSIRGSVFQLVSALTCTGFQTSNVFQWPTVSKLIVFTAMIIGGAAGSTAGGIKIFRSVLVFKGTARWFKKISLPSNAIFSFNFNGDILDDDTANRIIAEASIITILWIIILAVGMFTLLHTVPETYNLSDVMFEVASAQGNVGLSTGIVGPNANPITKGMLIINMWIGRLEIIPVLMLFRTILGIKRFPFET